MGKGQSKGLRCLVFNRPKSNHGDKLLWKTDKSQWVLRQLGISAIESSWKDYSVKKLDNYAMIITLYLPWFHRDSSVFWARPVTMQLTYFVVNNIQATISAVWLAENMSINPKLVSSAISPVQKKWNWVQNGEIKMTDSSDIARTNKMADKSGTKIETFYLNFNTKTS